MPDVSRNIIYRYGPVCFLLIFMAGAGRAVTSESAAKKATEKKTAPASSKKRPIRRQLKKLRAASEKALTPHKNFQGPRSHTLPANAPVTPTLTPLPPPPQRTKTERFFGAAASLMTTTWNNNIFVWLPAFSTDPNTGPTYGIMPVLVLSESEHHHIQHLLAPSYTYNRIFGQTVTGRYYFYPTDDSQLVTIASYSQRTNREVKARYENTSLLGGRMFVRGEGYYDVDGAQRFFGIGPATSERDESGYTGREKVVHGDIGVNFLEAMRFSFGTRYRRQGFDETIVPDISDISTKFPGVSREEINTVVQEFHLLWDSRDLPITPSKGRSGELFFEKTAQNWGSDSDYIRYGLDGRRLFPWPEHKQTTVIHGLFDQANGPNIPFYELAKMGGRDTLRGFGEGRFRDRGRIVFNAEQRFEMTTLEMMGVKAKFELGPFFDIGEVFDTPDNMQSKYLQPVLGGSFRAVVVPNVVGSVDVGVGREGIATFVDINYPF